MFVLIYEEIKNQIQKLIDEAEVNKEAAKDNDKAWNYWERKLDHLYSAKIEIERAQYQKKPGMN